MDMTTQPSTQSTTTTEPSTLPPTSTSTSIYASLHAYPFSTDPAFLAGLSQIFGHPNVPVTETELAQNPDLALSAKCFYYKRKFNTPGDISAAGYKAWLAEQANIPNTTGEAPSTTPSTCTPSSAPTPAFSSAHADSNSTINTATATTQSTSTSATQSSTSSSQPPPYPTSFADIVELITNNKPIPGIEEIPDTVLEAGSSKQDRATRRRKPWEKDDEDGVVTVAADDVALRSDGGGNEMGGNERGRGEGLLRLLRPDAVPDSGLVAKE